MNKIICEVCGTTYQDTADHCPICGYSRTGVRKVPFSATPTYTDSGAAPTDVPKKKAIFDFDEENADTEVYEDSQENTYVDPEDFETYEEAPRSNTLAVIALVVIITILLIAIGFLFFRFYLPNKKDTVPAPTAAPTAAATVPETPEETTEPTIPCTSLVLTSGVTELNREGQYWLLHVTVLPEDTTDQLIFSTEDASVATVNEHGRITAVGEGETNIYITCGEKEIKCKVVVNFDVEPTAPMETEAQKQPESVDHEEAPEAGQETTAATEPEETKATDGVILKLKDKDLSSSRRGVTFTLELDCDLDPVDVKWITLDSSVATVHNGEVTTIGPGRTKIIAQYGDQQVECIIRCTFS